MDFDLKEFIATIGYIGVFAIVFAESGLLIGFFLPGDSLLFTAGVIAGSSKLQDTLGVELSYPILAIGCFIAAVSGDSVGYWFGKRVGRRLFQRKDSLFFKKKYLIQAEEMYHKHGGKIIVIARFIPIVRTFAPIVAGIGTMHYRRFISYNVFGGLLWAVGVVSMGYFLGDAADGYLLPIVAAIIIISVLPPVIHVLHDYLKERNAKAAEVTAIPDPDVEAS
ncbi:MAG: VTT domain-containing protein [Anaerolineae bacterium]|nr:VTT domain-containing protein [Anaerolineae bacterium]